MATPEITNPYEQIWKTRDLRALDAPVEIDSKLSSFERGLGRFGKQMTATGYALPALGAQLVEKVTGENEVTKGITDWGLEGYNKAIEESQTGIYAPKVAGIENIKTAFDAMDWAGGVLGEQLPMVASLALTGGVGGAIARLGANAGVKALAGAAVGDVVKTGVQQGALKAAAGQVITADMKKAAAKALMDTTIKGAAVGAYAGTAGLEGGLAFGEQVSQGVKPADAVASSIAVGGINGALELVTPYVVAKNMGLGAYAKNSIRKIITESPDLSKKAIALATAKELGTRAAKGGAEGMVTEGLTEGLQELTSIAGERWAKNDPLFAELKDEDWSRIKNSAAAGAFVGGALSGAGATLSGPAGQQKAPTESKPGTTPPAGETKVQVLEAMAGKLDAAIAAATAAGDTAKVEELQQAKVLLGNALVQEAKKAQGTTASETSIVPPVETPVVEPPIQTVPPTQEVVPPVQETPLDLPPPAQEPTVQQEPSIPPTVVSPAPPGGTVQLKQGEEVILTPPKPGESKVNVVPTQEEVDKLKALMGEKTVKQELLAAPTVEPAVNPTEELTPFGDKITEEQKAQEAQALIEQEKSKLVQLAQIKSALVPGANTQKIDKEIQYQEQFLKQLQEKANAQSLTGETPPAPELTPPVQETPPMPELPAQDAQALIEQEKEKLSQLVQDKSELAPNTDTLEIDQAIETSLTKLAQLSEDTLHPQKPNITPPTQKPIPPVNPWTVSELKYDIKTNSPNLATKWGQEVADAVASTDKANQNGTWLADLSTKATPQPEGELAKALKSGKPISEALGGTLAKSLVESSGFAPNTIEALVKISPEGWKLAHVTQSTENFPSMAYWSKKDGNTLESVSYEDGKFKFWGNNADAKVFNSYGDLTAFLDSQKTIASVPAIAAAVQNGVSSEPLAAIKKAFKLGEPDAKWTAEYNPTSGFMVVSIKETVGSPQWRLILNDDENTLELYKLINGQPVQESISDITSLTEQHTEALEQVSPWIFAELLADIDFGKTQYELNNKWGPHIVNTAQAIKDGTAPIYNLFAALQYSPFFDSAANKVISPATASVTLGLGQLETFAKDDVFPPEFGGDHAQSLIKYDVFSPNTIEEFLNFAPPGWKFDGVYNGATIYPYFTNPLGTLFVEHDQYKLINNDGTTTLYFTYQELLDALSTVTQDSFVPPTEAKVNELKSLAENQIITPELKAEFQKLAPPGWTLTAAWSTGNGPFGIVYGHTNGSEFSINQIDFVYKNAAVGSTEYYDTYNDLLAALEITYDTQGWPNVVDEAHRAELEALAPPGWTLGLIANGVASYKNGNGQSFYYTPGNFEYYDLTASTVQHFTTPAELMQAINAIIQESFIAPSENALNSLKAEVAQNGFTPELKEQFKKLAPPGWELKASIASGATFNTLYENTSGGKFQISNTHYLSQNLLTGLWDIHYSYADLLAALAANAANSIPTLEELKTLVKNGGESAAVKSEFEKLAPPGWHFVYLVVHDASNNTFTASYNTGSSSSNKVFVISQNGYKLYGDSLPVTYSTYQDLIAGIAAQSQNNPPGNSPSPTPPVLPGEWSPTDPPGGYLSEATSYSTLITTPEGIKIHLQFTPTAQEVSDISHIHNYLKHAPLPFAEKLKLFKEFPTTQAQLTAFKANHPYLIRKVKIDEASTIEQAKELLNDVLIRRDKYTFDEILAEAVRFEEKYGTEEFVAALANAPKETTIGATISPAPHLDGWLQNMRIEEELISENPFEGIWADYEVNSGPSGSDVSASRYGVIIINPKTGKVLLRKVSNQYEGITWDFARGGADRFGSPNAQPNLIDTNAVSNYPVNHPSKRYMEHPLIAAKREAREEFGYDVKIIGQLAKGFFTGDGNMASLYYVGVPVSEQTNEHLQPSHGSHIKETDDTQWVDLNEARRLVLTEPTLGLDSQMKRDGRHMPRLARISRILEAVFNPDMQKSDLDYRSSIKGMEKYFKNEMFSAFPGVLPAAAANKDFNDLTELQKMQVAAGFYVSKRFPNADTVTKINLQKELFKKRKAALQSWMQDRIGSKLVGNILEGNASISTIQAKLAQTGGKVVLSLWHGTNKTREALLDDVINPVYFGSAWSGNDTKEGLFLTDTKEKAKAWGSKSQVNMLVAFNNLKVVPGTTQYSASGFASLIQSAKNDGYDGLLFDKVSDAITGRQVVVWNMENVTAAGGQGVGFTGKNLYQSKGELKERMDISTAKALLGETFGPLSREMLDSGFLEIVESGGPDLVAGQYFGEEQKIRIYLDYISSPRELIGAVLHEGAHAGMQEILGKSAATYYKEFLNSNKPAVKLSMYKTAWEGAQRFGIANSLTPGNAAEIERVRNELNKIDPNFLIEEDLANFVQQADKSSTLWQRIVNAIKVWWAQSAVGKALKERGIGFNLTEEMAMGLVTAALRSQSLRRGKDYSTYVAHVTGQNWPTIDNYPHGKPNLKYVLAGAGEGYIVFGWGFYALESHGALAYYKTTVGDKTYGLYVPDDIPPRLIEWDRSLSQQSSVVRDAITNSRDDYLLLRMAVKSKDRKTEYPGSAVVQLKTYGTGGALYNQLVDYFVKTKFNGMPDGYAFDAETNKQQRNKNMARRFASRKLAEYGLAGLRLLDAGSREVFVTKQPDGKYRIKQGVGSVVNTQILSEAEFEKHVGPDLAAAAKAQTVDETKVHAGFGYYNWVFWRQSDLDRFQITHKNGSQISPNPPKNVAYDPNGIGIPYAEHPGFGSYVVNPKTGQASFSKSTVTIEVSLEDLQSNIDSVMGEGWLKQAQAAGLVTVVERAGPKGESGSWIGNKLRLYTGSMPAGGSPIGVLLHEGKHATFAEVLGKSLESYVNDLQTLANNGNQTARKAIIHSTIAAANLLGIKHNLNTGGTKEDIYAVRAAIEERQPGLLAEEDLAYFVQYATETQSATGFLRRLINQIKAWFAQTKLGQRLKEVGLGFEMTDGMAVEWAKMGLHKSLAKLRQSEQVKAQVLYEAAYMPPSARLGRALEAATVDPNYSMSIQEFKDTLWTDPTDSRQEFVNKPGLLQKFRANFIDFFAEMEKKSTRIYDAYSLLRNKKSARLVQARQEYMQPLRDLIANGPWTAKEVGDMLAARHLKVDKVNTKLAEDASYMYTKQLLKDLPDAKRKELAKARSNVKAGKMPDGTAYVDANGNPATMTGATKQKFMFDLMNKYSQFEIRNPEGQQALRLEWEMFKDAAGGFSNGGVAAGKVRVIDDILAGTSKDQARFDRIANLFDAMNRHALQIREDGGLITISEHARLLLDKAAYAPLRRESYNVDREIEQLFRRAGQGGSKQLGTRTGTAALSEPTNVLQNALASLEASAAAAERNLANQELYEVVNEDRAAWKPWFSIVSEDKYMTHDEDGFLREKNATASNRADITLIHNGKKLVIRPNMHNERAMGFVRAVNNLDVQAISGPMGVLNWFNGIVRWTNVTASPVFLMMNAIKDPFTALYNLQASEAAPYTKEIFENYGKAFKALKKVFLDGNRDPTDSDVRMVEAFENAGGRTSFIEELKPSDDTWRSFDAQVARRQGNLKQVMAFKDKWLDGLENFNTLFENVMRLSTFNVLTAHEVPKTRAARIAQDLTTNFTRRGYKTQALSLWWVFFNSAVQGNYQVLRNILSSKRLQVLAGGTIALALILDLLGRALADDWDEIPEWDKERFIVLPIKVGGDFVKIPAPWAYNVLWRMGGMLGETLAGKRKPQDSVLDIAAMVATTFNPLGKPGSIAQAVSPTAADPFVQILENKDFSGNPIGPEGFPGAGSKANSELLWSSTPKGYQGVARFVNEITGGSAVESGAIDFRPGDYQILARFLTGSLGRFMSDATFGLKENIEKGIEGPKDLPVIREFVSDPYNPMRAQVYHTNIAAIYGAHKLEAMYREGPERDLVKLHEVRTERNKDLRMYSQATDVERQIKSLRVRIRTAENRNDNARVLELRRRMEDLQEKFNRSYKSRVD